MSLHEVGRILQSARGPGLIITRSNLSFAVRVQREIPDLSWTILTKDDLRGRGGMQLLRFLWGTRWRAVILEDAAAEIVRRKDLYRLVLCWVHGYRWIAVSHGADSQFQRVHPVREFIPVVVGLLGEAVATAAGLVYAYFLNLRLAGDVPPGVRGEGNRVAYLRTTFWFDVKAGGATSHSMGVIGGMQELGLDVDVWTTSKLPDPSGRLIQEVVVPRRRPSVIEEAAVAAFNRTFLAKVLPEIRKFNPAIIYHRHDAFSLAGLALARRLGAPLVLEVNGSEVWARKAWSRLYFERLARAMERTAFRGADRVVVVSEELVPTVLELGGVRERIVVSPNGVDVGRFRPEDDGRGIRESHSVPAGAVVCGFLGTFTRWHGVLFLAEQIVSLVKREPRLHFLFIGDGELRPQVQMKLEETGVSTRAAFTGLLEPSRVPAHLAACDILLSPHLPFEDGTPFFGSPTKLFEYMAAGRPVVASRLGQIGRVVEDMETGILYAPGDGVGFQNAVVALAESPDLRVRMGKRARERAEARFTWRASVHRALEGLIDLPDA